jgi:hypothetical protein
MLSRALRLPRAVPMRTKLAAPAYTAVRSVTTDAASASLSHSVPKSDDEPFSVNLSDESFETYELDPPPYTLEVTKKELKDMYREMVVTRQMEMAADRLYKEKKIRGFCHLSTGQEAVAVGIEHAITKEDDIITAYRCHGYALLRGASVRSIIGELLGRREGISYGKGGSMHMFAKGFYGGNGIVGAQVPVGAGLAFAHKLPLVSSMPSLRRTTSSPPTDATVTLFSVAPLSDPSSVSCSADVRVSHTARVVPCTCSPRASTAVTVSSVLRSPSVLVLPLLTSCRWYRACHH